MHWVQRFPGSYPHLSKLKEEELITEIIKETSGLYNSYLRWIDEPNVYTTTFENLVGPNGGGSRNKQIMQVINIAKHLGKNITKQEAEKIADSLFGDSYTFRIGKIGSWRGYFSENHKNLFKKYCNDILVKLGYERNARW
jgi:hypothetical protein